MNKQGQQIIGAIIFFAFVVLTYNLYDNFIREVLTINASYLSGFIGFIVIWEFWKFVFNEFRGK